LPKDAKRLFEGKRTLGKRGVDGERNAGEVVKKRREKQLNDEKWLVPKEKDAIAGHCGSIMGKDGKESSAERKVPLRESECC